ncbi:hypothetical protein P43SY_003601 [Pythium insidiosum]|uniref:ZSWIM1/3 RNaseH-like domain-containing protein n=1 Tax=Pythium insidiosum TaxID=114742 RepID=A0AAD5LAF1_PYTIN|nr:hypothetical protein P43SY_003601 [Pythium insidiosum]
METISTVVDAFIQMNPAAARIKCFMVDKHFTEITVLKAMFPEAAVLLCQFHAVKYLRDVVLKYDLSPQQHGSLKDAMGLIVYAQSEQEYDKILSYMKRVVEPQHQHEFNEGIQVDSSEVSDLLTSADTSGFYDYFIRNWHMCRHMWCSFERDNVETVGVNTNNRLEATWRHIKTLIRSTDHLDVTLSHVEHYQRTLETEYNLNANPIARSVDSEYDEAMLEFANIVTEYAVQLVLPEYKFGTLP